MPDEVDCLVCVAGGEKPMVPGSEGCPPLERHVRVDFKHVVDTFSLV